jgi:hypothetical protein
MIWGYVSSGLFYEASSDADIVASKCMMTDECRIAEDLEECGYGLYEVLSRNLSGGIDE